MGTTTDKLNKLAATKADIKAALTEMGQTVDDKFSTYGDKIRSIKTAHLDEEMAEQDNLIGQIQAALATKTVVTTTEFEVSDDGVGNVTMVGVNSTSYDGGNVSIE